MPTKEEILRVRTAPFGNMHKFSHSHIHALRVSVLFGYEEYAKQEALEFNRFLNWDVGKYLGSSHEAAWQAYQQHKATEQKKISDAMQTHDELIKAKNAAK